MFFKTYTKTNVTYNVTMIVHKSATSCYASTTADTATTQITIRNYVNISRVDTSICKANFILFYIIYLFKNFIMISIKIQMEVCIYKTNHYVSTLDILSSHQNRILIQLSH